MPDSLEATYLRTALLLGLVRGESVLRWAEEAIEREVDPPAALFELVTVAADDLSGLRHALWPLVIEPDPAPVLESLLGVLHADLDSQQRSLADTMTILRQMRSMVRLPRDLYDSLTAAFVEHAQAQTIATWLGQFANRRTIVERRTP